MESATIRWMIGGVFGAFLAFVVLSDLYRKVKKARATPLAPKRREGFRPARPQAPRQQRSSWKAGHRR